jgi:hypothetical protein
MLSSFLRGTAESIGNTVQNTANIAEKTVKNSGIIAEKTAEILGSSISLANSIIKKSEIATDASIKTTAVIIEKSGELIDAGSGLSVSSISALSNAINLTIPLSVKGMEITAASVAVLTSFLTTQQNDIVQLLGAPIKVSNIVITGIISLMKLVIITPFEMIFRNIEKRQAELNIKKAKLENDVKQVDEIQKITAEIKKIKLIKTLAELTERNQNILGDTMAQTAINVLEDGPEKDAIVSAAENTAENTKTGGGTYNRMRKYKKNNKYICGGEVQDKNLTFAITSLVKENSEQLKILLDNREVIDEVAELMDKADKLVSLGGLESDKRDKFIDGIPEKIKGDNTNDVDRVIDSIKGDIPNKITEKSTTMGGRKRRSMRKLSNKRCNRYARKTNRRKNKRRTSGVSNKRKGT